MSKLFDISATESQIELFHVVETVLNDAMVGKTDQFLYNIDIYLSKTPYAKRMMVERGFSRLLELTSVYGWGITAKRLTALTDDYIAIFCALEDYVHVGVDMEDPNFSTALYTRSAPELVNLSANGQLDGDLERVLTSLVGAKTEKSVRDGNFVVARLDVVGERDGKPVFKPVIPRSNLDIGGGKKYVFIPVPFFYIFEDILSRQFMSDPFRFIMASRKGNVECTAAISSTVVRRVYKASSDNLVESKLTKVKCGYDVTKQQYFAYNLESSLHSVGLAQFRPEMLDAVKAVNELEIDKSKHNVNFTFLRGVYRTRVVSANTGQLESLRMLDLTSYANLKDKTEALLEVGENMPDDELYWFMNSHPDVFGDIDESLEKRERVSPKFLKDLKSVSLPKSEKDRLVLLTELLKTGVIKFTATIKGGAIFERVCSNNVKALERMLGKDYVKNYESIRTKLYYVRRLLSSGVIKSKIDLEKYGVEYNILDYIDPKVYFSDAIKHKRPEDAIDAIDSALKVMNQKASSYMKSPNLLLYRDLYVTNKFFGSVNVNSIIALDYAEVK
jgi:hypothetical protein